LWRRGEPQHDPPKPFARQSRLLGTRDEKPKLAAVLPAGGTRPSAGGRLREEGDGDAVCSPQPKRHRRADPATKLALDAREKAGPAHEGPWGPTERIRASRESGTQTNVISRFVRCFPSGASRNRLGRAFRLCWFIRRPRGQPCFLGTVGRSRVFGRSPGQGVLVGNDPSDPELVAGAVLPSPAEKSQNWLPGDLQDWRVVVDRVGIPGPTPILIKAFGGDLPAARFVAGNEEPIFNPQPDNWDIRKRRGPRRERGGVLHPARNSFYW